jgi:hydroxymethylpyrimidine/phosphomethylpyrimidine kinase
MRGRVLVIAGSDSGGGAGIQADIKTITMLGGFATTAVTAITAQNTLRVSDLFAVPPSIVEAQARAVLDDIGSDAIKTGMLGDVAMIEVVARVIDSARANAHVDPVVVDPVMVAKGGAALLPSTATSALASLLLPRATLLTPNAPEASALTGVRTETTDDLRRAGDKLLRMGAAAVLLKGGHIPGERVVDVLVTAEGETIFEGPRIDTRHTHGTGCTLASAVATGLAQGMSIREAIARAVSYVRGAMANAPGFGGGHGPLDHGWPLRSRS